MEFSTMVFTEPPSVYQKLHGGEPRAARTVAVAGSIWKYQPRVLRMPSIASPAALLTSSACSEDRGTFDLMLPKLSARATGLAGGCAIGCPEPPVITPVKALYPCGLYGNEPTPVRYDSAVSWKSAFSTIWSMKLSIHLNLPLMRPLRK